MEKRRKKEREAEEGGGQSLVIFTVKTSVFSHSRALLQPG